MEKAILRSVLLAAALATLPLALSTRAFSQNLVPHEALTASVNGQGGICTVSLVSDAETSNPAFDATVDGFSLAASIVVPNESADKSMKRLSTVFSRPALAVSAHGEMCAKDDSCCASLGCGLSHVFGDVVGVGVQYHFLNQTMSAHDKASASYVSLGLCIMPQERWSFGLTISNPTRSKLHFAEHSAYVPTTTRIALRWREHRFFFVAAEAEKSIGEEAVGKVAVGAYPVRGMYVTFGFCSEGARLSGGIGYDWTFVGVRTSVSHHDQLGVSAGCSLELHIGRALPKEDE